MWRRGISSLCSALVTAIASFGCKPADRNFDDAGAVACVEVEDCFNGVDDDCDGDTDCADSDCSAGAVCVSALANFQLGVLVGQKDPCPEGFTSEETLIYRGLKGGCKGCDCSANPTDCKADLWYYNDETACTSDVDQTGGIYAGKFGFNCAQSPINAPMGGSIYGARTGPFEVIQTCTAGGTPVKEPAGWGEAKKFCRAKGVGAGCAPGQACVPVQNPTMQCALAPGSAACDGYGTAQSDWFTSYSDTLSCLSCGCTASGGSCSSVTLWLGNDYSCVENTSIQEGQKLCSQSYAPPAFLKGPATDSICTAEPQVSGSLDPIGQSTLCCLK